MDFEEGNLNLSFSILVLSYRKEETNALAFAPSKFCHCTYNTHWLKNLNNHGKRDQAPMYSTAMPSSIHFIR